MSKTFDLSTLNLSAGTHEITVKARASGYADSVTSNAVSYVVESNTVQVSGTWYFNVTATQSPYQSVNFTSNNTLYDAIYGEHQDLSYYKNGEGTEVNWRRTWINEAYRTITFDGVQTVSKEFYEWLVANAVRQTITFTIDGTSYTALSGMTWGEWVDSEYNTGGFYAYGNAPDGANYVCVIQKDDTKPYRVNNLENIPVITIDSIIGNGEYILILEPF